MTERVSGSQGVSRTEFESTRIPSSDMADALERMAHGKQFWLADFGRGRRKRPDHEIEQKRQELEVLQQAACDYRTQPEPFRVSATDKTAERGARR